MEYKALKDIAKITMGQSPDSSSYNEEKDGLPFFQGNADFGELYPNERIWCNEPKKVAEPGDILISVRAPIGALNYAKDKCCIGRGLAAITIEDEAERNYVFHLLKARNNELNNKGTGSTFKAIGKNVLEEVSVPQISREEQQKCMDMMDLLESIIRERQAQLNKLDELIKARFVELFGDDIVQANLSIGDIAEETTVGIANSATHAYAESGVVMLRNQNIRVNYLDDSDLIYINPEFASKYDNKKLRENDILVTRTGVNVGMACLVPEKYAGCQTFTTLILRLKKNIGVSPTFVCHYINSPLGKGFIDDKKVGGAQPNFGAKQLATMPIAIPSEDKQLLFESFVKQVDKSKVVKLSA